MQRTHLNSKVQALIEKKPRNWEYLVYAEVFEETIKEHKKMVPTVAVVKGCNTPPIKISEIPTWISKKFSKLVDRLHYMVKKMGATEELAFGPAGEPGDVEKLLDYTELVTSYHLDILKFLEECSNLLNNTLYTDAIDALNRMFERSLSSYHHDHITNIRKTIEGFKKSSGSNSYDCYLRVVIDDDVMEQSMETISNLFIAKTERFPLRGEGYIYLLINPSMDGLVKIGKTERTPQMRAKELGAETGVPTPFIVVYEALVSDCSSAEKYIHNNLGQFRVSGNREFFRTSPTVAIQVMLDAEQKFIATDQLMVVCPPLLKTRQHFLNCLNVILTIKRKI